jgi:hypothetical protein
MNADKKRKLAAIAVASVVVLITGVNWIHSEAEMSRKLEPLMQSAGEHLSVGFRSGEEQAAFERRRLAFESMWKARDERDVAAELLPFLSDPSENLRVRAVRALGHLESAQAEAPLQALLDKSGKARGPQYEAVRGVASVTLRLALGRIRSREQKGEPRIAALAKSVGLTPAELVGLSQRINSRQGRYDAGSAADQIVEEIVDALYAMIKRGDNVSGVVKRLTLNPAQRVKLETAALPPEQEVEMLLDYLEQREIVTGDEMELGKHLSGMGPQAANQVLARLEQMQQQPKQIKGRGYSVLFDAVAEMKGPEALPLLRRFEQNSFDRWIPHYAKLARQEIEREEAMKRGDPKALSVPGYIVNPAEVLRPNP